MDTFLLPVATHILVGCTYVKPQKRILGGSNTQGAAPRNLGSTDAYLVYYQVQRTVICCPFIKSSKPHTGYTPIGHLFYFQPRVH